MFRRKTQLPDVPIYGFIGGIPEAFGGRTGVCLQRANAFAELDNRDVEILTLSPGHGVKPEYVTQKLRNEGRIGQRVTIRNFWADLRRASDDDLRAIAAKGSAVDGSPYDPIEFDGDLDSERRSSGGKLLQSDRFREDGTVVTSHRYPSSGSGEPVSRRVVLFDHSGAPLAQWEQQHFLYFAWMDWTFDGRTVVLINDGPALPYMHSYQRDNVVLIQTIHNKHSEDPDSIAGKLTKGYIPTLKYMDEYDRVAVLTNDQAHDLKSLHFASDNMEVLPNMSSVTPIKKIGHRDPSRGVMLARLVHQKRVEHAVTAMSKLPESIRDARLDVYGEGDLGQSISDLIKDLNLNDQVTLCGYDRAAREHFSTASFSVLSSRYEGQGLVLLESMAAGCIPIAYDIKYGPADIITDGVDGFLVTDGDTDALARRIEEVVTMDPRRRKKMRTAAVKRTLDFSPEVTTRAWGEMLTAAIMAKAPVEEVGGRSSLISASMDSQAVQVRVVLDGDAAASPDWAMLAWTHRQGERFGRRPAKLAHDDSRTAVEGSIPLEDFAAVRSGNIDLWVDLRVRGNVVRLRIKDVDKTLHFQFGRFVLYPTRHKSLSLEALAN